MKREGHGDDGAPSCYLYNAPNENGGDTIADPEAYHNKADVRYPPATRNERL